MTVDVEIQRVAEDMMVDDILAANGLTDVARVDYSGSDYYGGMLTVTDSQGVVNSIFVQHPITCYHVLSERLS